MTERRERKIFLFAAKFDGTVVVAEGKGEGNCHVWKREP